MRFYKVINSFKSYLKYSILINSVNFSYNNKINILNQAIIVFYNSNKVISFYKNNLNLGFYNIYKLSKLLISKLFSGIYYNLIKRA